MRAIGTCEHPAGGVKGDPILSAAGFGRHRPVVRVDDESFAAHIERRGVRMQRLRDHAAVVTAATVNAVVQAPVEIVE